MTVPHKFEPGDKVALHEQPKLCWTFHKYTTPSEEFAYIYWLSEKDLSCVYAVDLIPWKDLR